jgi:Flp pilus assembly protein CpaB
MYQRRNGRQLILVGIVIIVVVLLAGLFFLTRGSSNTTQNTSTRLSPVVVALQAIPEGTPFRAGQPLDTFFGVRQVPANAVPFGAYTGVAQIADYLKSTGCQPSGVAGCQGQVTTTETIYQGLPVVSGMFSSLGPFRVDAGPAFRIPYGYVGVALNLSDINSVVSSIHPGDDVDLIASYTGQASKLGVDAPPQTQYIMNDVRVIGVGGPPPAAGATAAVGGGTLMILARYQQALIIQHLKDFGWQLSAVLRSAKETDIPHFKTLPVTDRWFFFKTTNPFRTHLPY